MTSYLSELGKTLLYNFTFCVLLFSRVAGFAQNKQSLENLLWEEVGGRISDMDAEEKTRTTITDAAACGCLRVYYEDQGGGCPFESTVAGYKKTKGGYTVLKTYWDGCGWSKT